MRVSLAETREFPVSMREPTLIIPIVAFFVKFFEEKKYFSVWRLAFPMFRFFWTGISVARGSIFYLTP